MTIDKMPRGKLVTALILAILIAMVAARQVNKTSSDDDEGDEDEDIDDEILQELALLSDKDIEDLVVDSTSTTPEPAKVVMPKQDTKKKPDMFHKKIEKLLEEQDELYENSAVKMTELKFKLAEKKSKLGKIKEKFKNYIKNLDESD